MSGTANLMPPASLVTDAEMELRAEVRAFLAEQHAGGRRVWAVDSWLSSWDEDFSRELAARGWVGMTVPVEYGGRGRTFRERFAVVEELLAAGAPVAAHWIADRQIAPSLLTYGTEEQKRAYLPRIAAGESYWGIGMSEPNSGSDLASVLTRAERVDGGWTITGNKVWTSGAHRAHAFIVLARSAPLDTEHRHAGLSQFVVEFAQDGVEVRPIVSMNGDQHFNEVFLDEVFVPDSRVLGEVGQGWQQVTSELGFERSGPERVLSTFPLLTEIVQNVAEGRLDFDADLGRLVARVTGLHQMSMAVSGALQRREPADVSAAVVKVMGTTTEGDVADYADLLFGDGSDVTNELRRLTTQAVDQRPGFTLRGGTNEVLRGVIARGLGLR